MRRLWLVLGAAAPLAGCAVGGVPPVANPSAPRPAPDDDAARQQFEIFRGRSDDERLRTLWRERFLVAQLNRAFAVSSHYGAYAAGQPSADAAVTAALRACETFGEPCVPYAVNTGIVYPGVTGSLPSRGRALGPFTPSPEYLYHGPAGAKGVIVWSHGTDTACSAYGTRVGAPSVIAIFNRTGWDVVRFDRDPCADDFAAALRRMPAGIAAAREAGYRKIVLAGQSRGAMQSFELLRDPAVAAAVSGIIGFSPAMSGSDGAAATIGPQRWAAVASAPTGPMPAAVFFFGQDPFTPHARQQVEQTNAMWQRRLPHGRAYFDDAPGMLGHGAEASRTFTDKYATCLLALIDRDQTGDSCPH